MTQIDLLFDAQMGQALKKMGLESASEARKDALELGRAYCKKAALSRSCRTSHADDATRGFVLAGLPADLLGNAAGSLYRTSEWEFTGKWVSSARTTNHGRENRLWRLKLPDHDIAASNARQNEYWIRQGGHPLLGEHDE